MARSIGNVFGVLSSRYAALDNPDTYGIVKRVKKKEKGKTMSISTKMYFSVVVAGEKYAAETTVTQDTAEAYQKDMSDLFSTMSAKVDERGEDLFVTFEPRSIYGAGTQKPAGSPLPNAPDNLPNCPFHNIPIKEKTGRNGVFYSCSERNASGGYCNWRPTDPKR